MAAAAEPPIGWPERTAGQAGTGAGPGRGQSRRDTRTRRILDVGPPRPGATRGRPATHRPGLGADGRAAT
ncbi:hypothetical protein, partial [Frankia sp. AgKG'84/4]|uniref:hypothetical protein n=1 Tax=Frankia sp. AgKG'84/4 TaxID=573490 RepID=UPI00202A5A01